jgi:hypothetical protein
LATPCEHIPFVVKSSDKLPAGKGKLSYVTPGNLRDRTLGDQHVKAVYGVPELHESVCEKADRIIRPETPEKDCAVYAQKSWRTVAGSL